MKFEKVKCEVLSLGFELAEWRFDGKPSNREKEETARGGREEDGEY